MLDTQCPTC